MNKMHAFPSLTEEQIVKALECCMAGGLCHECPCYGGACVVGGGYALDLIRRQKDEIDRLTLTLCGVMHFVDKWLDDEELDKDEVIRAATMREKTLAIVEGLQAQLSAARADAVREFADRVLDLFPADKPYTSISRTTIKRFVRELTEDENERN